MRAPLLPHPSSTLVVQRVWRALLMTIALALGACAGLPPPDSHRSTALAPVATDALVRVAAASMPPGSSDGFRPLPASHYSLDARLALARRATSSLDVQYYELANDATGRRLLRTLRDASQRGVRVRLLIDDLHTVDSARVLTALAAYPNVEVRVFNPFLWGRSLTASRWALALFDLARVNHRMHNKLFIADGAFAIAGGRNIADEYFFLNTVGNFIDFDMLIAGHAVPAMETLFDGYWNSPRVRSLDRLESVSDNPVALQGEFERLTQPPANALDELPPSATDLLGFGPLSYDLQLPPLRLLGGRAEVFADDPEKVSGRSAAGDDPTTVMARVFTAMADAKSEVLIVSPYVVPGDLGMRALKQLRERGVGVTLITNTMAASDNPFTSAAYSRYRRRLLKMGVEIYEISSAELASNADIGPALGQARGRSHVKALVIDRRVSFVGSLNMDIRSSRVNTEMGMLVESTELADIAMRLIDGIRAAGSYRLKLVESTDSVQWISTHDGHPVVLDDEPELDLATRLKVLLLSPFIAESLL